MILTTQFFNRGIGTIQFVSSFTPPGVIHPIDIAIDQTGSLAGNPANDRIWIADDFSDQIVGIRRDGSVVQRIRPYSYFF